MVRVVARGDDLLLYEKKKARGGKCSNMRVLGACVFLSINQSINRKARDGDRRKMSSR